MMIKFKDFLYLAEKLITLGGKSYPKYGNVVVLSGGAASGKSFIVKNLLGLDAKTIDVDDIKKYAQKTQSLIDSIKKSHNIDISKLDMRIPKNVSLLHSILTSIDLTGMDGRYIENILYGLKDAKYKPNLIYDVTLRDITKLHNITFKLTELMGYEKKNLHIVWVLSDLETALQQNVSRTRIVPEDILIDTHKGAARTMYEIINMGDKIKNYLDGDIWVVFNKIGVDVKAIMEPGSKTKVKYIEDVNYFKLKNQGENPISISELKEEIFNKIKDYVPIENTNWNKN
jgi:hypothetical protein